MSLWFGSKLKTFRDRKGLSQKGLAELAGVSLGTVASWEQGAREPTATMLYKIVAALGISCEEFTPTNDDAAAEAAPRPGRGRPRIAKVEEQPSKPKRGRGRPKKSV